jgi:hypothetical protein
MRGLHRLPLLGEQHRGGLIGFSRGVQALAQIAQLHLQLGARFGGGIALRMLMLELDVNLFELALDLAAPLQRALGLLGEAHMIELQVVTLLLQIFGLAAQLERFLATPLQLFVRLRGLTPQPRSFVL